MNRNRIAIAALLGVAASVKPMGPAGFPILPEPPRPAPGRPAPDATPAPTEQRKLTRQERRRLQRENRGRR